MKRKDRIIKVLGLIAGYLIVLILIGVLLLILLIIGISALKLYGG